MKKYLLYYLSFTIVILGLGLIIKVPFPTAIHPSFNWMMIFFYCQSIFIAYLHYLAHMDREKLPIYFLGATAFRMLTVILFWGIIVIAKIPDHVLYIINSGLVYLLYLTFEIILLLVNLRPNSAENR